MAETTLSKRILPRFDQDRVKLNDIVQHKGIKWTEDDVECSLWLDLLSTNAARVALDFSRGDTNYQRIEIEDCIDDEVLARWVEEYDIPFTAALDEDQLNSCITQIALLRLQSIELAYGIGGTEFPQDTLEITIRFPGLVLEMDTPLTTVANYIQRIDEER